uniref:Coiled-coil domain-containing protein n=1 Tax=Canis lupus dingo TaxID=286419 RepID=A0A8C0L4A9_CANLU
SYRTPLEILWSCHFKEKEKQRQAELQEKKEIAEKKFKEWLENAKNKPRPAAKSYGYANGKLTVEILIQNQPFIIQFHGNPFICLLPKKLRTYRERRLKGL